MNLLKQQNKYDVTVVGAGPTGLATAIALKQNGVSVCVLDQRSCTTSESRGMVIHARTLESIESFGEEVINKLVNTGRKLERSNTVSDQKILATARLSARQDTTYQFALILAQADTESILSKKYESLGGTIFWNTKVDKLVESTSGADLEIQYCANSEKEINETLASEKITIHSDWVIGCDGAHSTIRHQCGIGFEGARYPLNLWAADLQIDNMTLPNIDTESFGSISEQNLALVIQLPKQNMYRIIIAENWPDKNSSVEPQDVDLEFYKKVVAIHYPDSATKWKFSEPVWNNHFRIHCRMADQFRSSGGRCFLAGDSAHLFSPLGGQGMNMGIHDAMNLAWKLSQVILKQSPESILDTYESERKQIIKQANTAADFSTKLVGTHSKPLVWLRNNILFPLGTNVESIHTKVVARFQGLSTVYQPNTPLFQNDIPSFIDRKTKRIVAGCRLPNDVVKLEKSTARLFTLFPMGVAHLIFFRNDRDSVEAVESFTSKFVMAYPNNSFTSSVVYPATVNLLPSDDISPSFTRLRKLRDWNNSIASSLQPSKSGCLFVRPDGYVGYCSTTTDYAPLLEYLNKLYITSGTVELPLQTIALSQSKTGIWDAYTRVLVAAIIIFALALLFRINMVGLLSSQHV